MDILFTDDRGPHKTSNKGTTSRKHPNPGYSTPFETASK